MTRLALALPLALAAAVAAVPGEVSACMPIGQPGVRIDIASETALIVWDEATKTEHFIRGGLFHTTGYDFGFLVPTPHRPDLGEVGEGVFAPFEKLTAPAVEVRGRTPSPFGCFAMGAKLDGSRADFSHVGANVPGGVAVLEEKKVGGYDAAVLAFVPGAKAEEPEAGAAELGKWLRDHGYPFTESLGKWLVPYVRDGWIVTAFKITGRVPAPTPPPGATAKAAPRGPASAVASAVRMSFKADRPVYPYREPEEARDEKARTIGRLLRVFVVAPKRMAGAIGDGSAHWPGRTVWANRLADDETPKVLAGARLPAALPAGEWWLTEFEDRSSPRRGTDELYFSPAPDQSPVARPPVIRYVDDWTAWYVVGAGLPLLAAAGFVLLRRMGRTA